jgi:hypothetical protein
MKKTGLTIIGALVAAPAAEPTASSPFPAVRSMSVMRFFHARPCQAFTG